MVEERRQVTERNVAVLVDGKSDDLAAVLPKPRGVVRASAEKRDSKRSTGDDHFSIFLCDELPATSLEPHRAMI